MQKEDIFNKIEFDIAKELVNIGLSKAADSLSFFTKEKVFLSSINIDFGLIDSKQILKSDENNLTLLTTQLRGDMEGYCHLIFTADEVDNLARISLPESVLNDNEKYKEMQKAILLEADNIITASVVTQFSNLFKNNMHGYVPQHMSGSKTEIVNKIREGSEGKYALCFNALLASDQTNIAPEFLWCLDSSFVDAVKTFAQQDDYLQKLRNLS